ncbi:hypothetical protein [Celeribacter sp.]|uniref:hypothetical protein n=1 Tax=Celeribacter sp. TaxID=1890673 RepID=UPI003A939864
MNFSVFFEITRPFSDYYFAKEWFEAEDDAFDFVEKLLEEKAVPVLGEGKGYEWSIYKCTDCGSHLIAWDEVE